MDGIEITHCDEYIDNVVKAALREHSGGGIDESGCVVLPSQYRDDGYYYAQETIDFVKFFREVCPEVPITVLTGGDIEVRSLHSFDIFMPIIWIAQNVILSVVLNVVSSYIYDRLKGRESEEADVDLSFVVERDGEKKMIHFKGPASEFAECFKGVDLNEL